MSNQYQNIQKYKMNQYKQNSEKQYTYYVLEQKSYKIKQVSQSQAYKSYDSFRKVQKKKKSINENKKFEDQQFNYDTKLLRDLDGRNQIVWARLGDLVKPSGSLFASQKFSLFSESQKTPSFLLQIGLLPISFYKTIFITRDFTKNGAYQVIINISGHFRICVVDDKIPVNAQTKQPIWGMQKMIFWQLILLKVWAKVLGGYQQVNSTKAFQFIRTFSYPNWIFKNMQKQTDMQQSFQYFQSKLQINQQFDPKKIKQRQQMYEKKQVNTTNKSIFFCMIARTKNSPKVKEYGLTPNAAAYQVVQAFQMNGIPAFKIKSSINNRWNGKFSVLDQKINNIYKQQLHDINISKSFIMSFQDFRKLFNLVIASPLDLSNISSVKHTFFQVQLPPNNKSSQHFELIIQKQSAIDLSIIQGKQCYQQHQTIQYNQEKISNIYSQITPGNTSQKNLRYLKMKYLISKVNQNPKKINIQIPQTQKGPQHNSQIIKQDEFKYSYGQATYPQGLSAESTYFYPLQKGKYIIHIKLESINVPTSYTINAVSKQRFKLSKITLKRQQKNLLWKSSLLDLANDQQSEKIYFTVSNHKQTKNKNEWIIYGEHFSQIGYGYVVFCTKQPNSKLYCEYNPKKLKEQGYHVKETYKDKDTNIGVFSSDNIPRCIVLKKIRDKVKWPPLGFKFYKIE